MLKRIYTILFTGTLLSMQPIFAAPQKSTNIKKIIQKKDKIIVIIHENGKDRELTLTRDALNMLLKKNKKSAANKKKVTQTKTTTAKKSTVEEKLKKEEAKKSITKKTTKENKSKKVTVQKKEKTKKVAIQKSTKKIAQKKSQEKIKKGQYKVAKGDTLFSIALKYKVSLADLVKLNKLKSTTLIHPGDIIKIPGTSFIESAKKEVAANKKTVYKVQHGDTLYSISKKYNMKVATLKKLNNLIPHPKLKPGMELTVIGKPVEIKRRRIPTKHIVKSGETIWTIAKKHNLTIRQLRLLNPRIKTHRLEVGTILNTSKRAALQLEKLARYKKRSSRLSGVLARYKRQSRSGSSRDVVAYAKRFLGTRYVWGASRPGAFDCSGFTQYVMRHAKGRSIPRVSRRQAYYGRYVSRRNLRAGDLIFFDTSRRRRGYVNHVGIYIGNGKFIHASSGKHRVVITSLNKPFYRQRFMWGRRIN